MANANSKQWDRTGNFGARRGDEHTDCGELSRLANTKLQQRQGSPTDSDEARGRDEESATLAGLCSDSRPGPTNGFWRDADWLFCRDGKWRPVEPGTFPLADRTASRVGRLRAYGNAINAEAATVFIQSVMELLNSSAGREFAA